MQASTMATDQTSSCEGRAATPQPSAPPTQPRRKRAALPWALGLAVLGATLAATPTNTAQAADFWVCGHHIFTDYNQGWVRIYSATLASRLRVRGRFGNPDTGASSTAIADMIPVLDQFPWTWYWGFNQAWVYIPGFEGHPHNCITPVR
jgi:ferric-dicitrate binding protein FerR (iron transport regulator)